METAAVILAIAYLVLAIRENRWCWPAGIASALLYLGVFYGAGLYMEAWLQVFYAGMGVYGWWAWRPAEGGSVPLAIHRWPLRRHGAALAVIAVLTVASGSLLTRYTAAEAPWLDSFITWSAVLTTWMVARKLLENWLYWFVIDGLTLGLALERGLYPTAGLFAIYLVLVVLGWRSWLSAWERRAVPAP
ncbi:MAG: nicotinamide riboside transporter PnuC [Gammaproteobacteria bacterium]